MERHIASAIQQRQDQIRPERAIAGAIKWKDGQRRQASDGSNQMLVSVQDGGEQPLGEVAGRKDEPTAAMRGSVKWKNKMRKTPAKGVQGR